MLTAKPTINKPDKRDMMTIFRHSSTWDERRRSEGYKSWKRSGSCLDLRLALKGQGIRLLNAHPASAIEGCGAFTSPIAPRCFEEKTRKLIRDCSLVRPTSHGRHRHHDLYCWKPLDCYSSVYRLFFPVSRKYLALLCICGCGLRASATRSN